MISNKYKRMFVVIIVGALSISSLGGCSKRETVKEKDITEWVSKDSFNSLLVTLDNLMNARYNGVKEGMIDEYSGEFEQTTYDKIKEQFKVDDMSEYYSIEDKYQEYLERLRYMVSFDGGVISDDLQITYPNGIKETGGEESGEHGEHGEYGEYGGSEEVSVEVDGEIVINEGAEVSQSETVESQSETVESSEEAVESTEFVSEIESSISYEESGDEAEGGELIENDLRDINGNLVWKAKTKEEVANMSKEELAEFNNIVSNMRSGYKEVYDKALKEAEEVESLVDAANNGIDPIEATGDGILMTLEDYKSSECIQVVNGIHVIPWSYIMENYSREDNRVYFDVLGYKSFIDVTGHTDISVNSVVGKSEYKFIRANYELIDNDVLNITYDSYNDKGELAHRLNVTCNIVDSKIKMDEENIKHFRNLYD